MDVQPRIGVACDALNSPYWTGGRDGTLHIMRCAACSRYFHPPAPICPDCRSSSVRAEPVSGRGTVYSFTVNHRPWVPQQPVPFVVALVAIEEDSAVLLPTNIVECPAGAVHIGMAVEVLFEPAGELFVPLFRPQAA